jgi:hypothetical protein
MSPVQSSKVGDPRSLALALGGLAVAVALLVLVFAYAVPKLTESGSLRVGTSSAPLDLGDARQKAELVARDGPIPFADPTGGSRDVYVQHLGDDPLKGWLAFDARRPGTGRECTLQWDAGSREFTDPCGGSRVPADGGGLPHYPVEVDGDGRLLVRLVTPATSPPSTIQITGSGGR